MVQHRRTRDGCWTCRRRKKKCDDSNTPCGNCARLNLQCQREVDLVWEDDTRRKGMRRRGPRKAEHHETDVVYDKCVDNAVSPGEEPGRSNIVQTVTLVPHSMSLWPQDLNTTEYILLEHYVNRFSRMYPTISGPGNPFLKVFLPLAMRNRAVLDALLALGGVQSWGTATPSTDRVLLNLRHKALRGCRKLLGETNLSGLPSNNDHSVGGNSSGEEDLLFVLASCGMLLLYEKLSGAEENGCTPHLQFFSRLLGDRVLPAIVRQSSMHAGDAWGDAFRFLVMLFLYNDLVRATSLQEQILSTTFIQSLVAEIPKDGNSITCDPGLSALTFAQRQFAFPQLIARLSAREVEVTDAEIESWDGCFGWVPSFALVSDIDPSIVRFIDYAYMDDLHYQRLADFYALSKIDDRAIITELYRIAAMVYRRQCLFQPLHCQLQNNLASWGAQLIHSLPDTSTYRNMLLWPIGIIAKELSITDWEERLQILDKLEFLEGEYQMQHFGRARAYFVDYWHNRDEGYVSNKSSILFG